MVTGNGKFKVGQIVYCNEQKSYGEFEIIEVFENDSEYFLIMKDIYSCIWKIIASNEYEMEKLVTITEKKILLGDSIIIDNNYLDDLKNHGLGDFK